MNRAPTQRSEVHMERFNDGNIPLRPDALDDDSETYPVQFPQLDTKQAQAPDRNVDDYNNVSLSVSIELGRVNMSVQEILGLREGSVIETEKLSGNPMEIMVNNQVFGRGEVVVVGDNLAIRITELFKVEESKKDEGG